MSNERFDNDVTILRTSVPEDLARAVDALTAAGIQYRLQSENDTFLKLTGRVHSISVDAWHEEAALDAVHEIPTEYELPNPLGENAARSERTMASAYIAAFVGAIVTLIVAFLWRRFS